MNLQEVLSLHKEIASLSKEILDINKTIFDLQTKAQEKTKRMEELTEKVERLGNEEEAKDTNPEVVVTKPEIEVTNDVGILVALKFARGNTVYTYKTDLIDLTQGEIVAVKDGNRLLMGVVVNAGDEPVAKPENGFIPLIREYDIDPKLITDQMKKDYRALKDAMKDPAFFEIAISAEPSSSDTYAVSVRFLGAISTPQEYTYLTDNNSYKRGDLVIVPTGQFNLPKRAMVVGYVDFPKDDGVKYKRVFSSLAEFENAKRA